MDIERPRIQYEFELDAVEEVGIVCRIERAGLQRHVDVTTQDLPGGRKLLRVEPHVDHVDAWRNLFVQWAIDKGWIRNG